MSTINKYSSDRFKVILSNIPRDSSDSEEIDISLYNNFVNSITLPDYNVELFESQFGPQTYRQPISRKNENITPIIIEYKIDEDMYNYYYMVKWMQEIRRNDPVKNETKIKDSNIKQITFLANDNENRKRMIFKFKECFLINISSLTLQYGSSEDINFSCTFMYNEFELEKSTIVANN